MSSSSSCEFEPGGVVWVKCGTHYWPGEVKAFEDLPSHVKKDFEPSEDTPECIVKFFDEDGYEFLQDTKGLFPYNCPKKEEFIQKGLIKSRRTSKEGSSWFAKFPNDIVRCEILTKGDPNILEKEPYVQKTEKVNYKEIFKSAETSASPQSKRRKRSAAGGSTPTTSGPSSKRSRTGTASPKRPISHPRFKPGASDHKIKILPQPSSPYHLDLAMKQEKAAQSPGNNYTCSICGFSASRLNVIILHNKSHSSGGGSRSSGSPGALRGSSNGAASPKAAATPSSSRTPAKKASPQSSVKKPSQKKPRLTKKLKEQKAKEEEEMKVVRRKKILDDWSDEDDKVGQDVPRRAHSDDEDMEVYMGDDHLHQNCSDEENDSYEKSKEDEMSAEKDTSVKEDSKEASSSSDSEDQGALMSSDKDKIEDSIVSTSDEELIKKPVDREKQEASPGKEFEVSSPSQKEELPVESNEPTDQVSQSPHSHQSNEAEVLQPTSDSTEKTVFIEGESKTENVNSTSDDEAKKKTTGLVDDECVESALVQNGSHKEGSSNGGVLSSSNENSSGNVVDINQVLEETQVPSLPEDLKDISKLEEDCRKKGMRVIAPKSSMSEDAWDVEDEFMDESARKGESAVSTTTSSSSSSSSTDDKKNSLSPKGNSSPRAVEEEAKSELDSKAIMAVISKGNEGSALAAVVGDNHSQLLQGGEEEETYILLVDDGSGTVDSLNSQTLFIDPNSLASGDLSNMVLMTSSAAASSVIGKDPSANSGKDILALALQQQHIVTTVDTTAGVAIVPGIASSSSLSKVPLISTQATPSGPLMTPEVLPTQVPPGPSPDSTSSRKSQ